MNGISIFLMGPGAQQPLSSREEETKSRLVEALKRKREDEKHREMMQKMEQLTKGVGNLPHLEHSAGGTG